MLSPSQNYNFKDGICERWVCSSCFQKLRHGSFPQPPLAQAVPPAACSWTEGLIPRAAPAPSVPLVGEAVAQSGPEAPDCIPTVFLRDRGAGCLGPAWLVQFTPAGLVGVQLF